MEIATDFITSNVADPTVDLILVLTDSKILSLRMESKKSCPSFVNLNTMKLEKDELNVEIFLASIKLESRRR